MDNHFFLHVFYLAMNTFTYSKIKKKTLLTIRMCRKGKMLIYLTHQIEQAWRTVPVCYLFYDSKMCVNITDKLMWSEVGQ